MPMAERPQTFNDVLVDFLDEEGPAEEKEPTAGGVAGGVGRLLPELRH